MLWINCSMNKLLLCFQLVWLSGCSVSCSVWLVAILLCSKVWSRVIIMTSHVITCGENSVGEIGRTLGKQTELQKQTTSVVCEHQTKTTYYICWEEVRGHRPVEDRERSWRIFISYTWFLPTSHLLSSFQSSIHRSYDDNRTIVISWWQP